MAALALAAGPQAGCSSEAPALGGRETALGSRQLAPGLARTEETAKPPNVLMIAFDNVRADRLSSYGNSRKTTSRIDALAASGVRFAEVHAQAPYTPYSFSSLFSSLYVADLPVRQRTNVSGSSPGKRAGLEPYHVTLPEALQQAGYYTAGTLQGWFTPAFGLDQGFDWAPYEKRSVRTGTDETLGWLREWKKNRSDQPFFFLHYTIDVHYVFMNGRKPEEHVFGGNPDGYNFSSDGVRSYRTGKVVPGEAGLANALTLYDEGLYWADREIAPLLDELDALGISDSTLVVFVSDHGEEFGEHGYLSHGQSNFRSVVTVPLIFAGPGVAQQGVVETPVMNIDIMPTILELCGVPIPETVKGLSLAAALRGEPQPELEHRPLFSEGAWNGFAGSVSVGNYRYLLDEDQRPHLYDWHNDPEEQHNLAGEMPDLTRRLDGLLFRHKREGLATRLLIAQGVALELDFLQLPDYAVVRRARTGPDPQAKGPVLDDEATRQLQALGYLQ